MRDSLGQLLNRFESDALVGAGDEDNALVSARHVGLGCVEKIVKRNSMPGAFIEFG